ncbi:ATPase, T2SS/T4P/T4SS family [Burkholderia gladioli]|uniref:ATPase, T2SS/T4P/T4SS family n=1 Tax=Burkholderia gladioli TaxID=28095 RepID=UPI001C5D727B|nr:ATPase, T2SS/T4P/T4SS family [Burkholderia gladioli]MBW5286507.1 Flp pilus assembly complex ATPase component TadA [Burkholderia gladioli]
MKIPGKHLLESGNLLPRGRYTPAAAAASSHNGKHAPHASRASSPDVPDHLADHVVCVQVDDALTVYVDVRKRSTSVFDTWLHHVRHAGHDPELVSVPADELQALRRQHRRVEALAADTPEIHRDILRFLAYARAVNASDMHVTRRAEHTDMELRIDGKIFRVNARMMTAQEGDAYILAIYNALASNKPAQFGQRQFQNAQIDGDKLAQTGIEMVRIIRGPCEPVSKGGNFLVARLQHQADFVNEITAQEAWRALDLMSPKKPDGDWKIDGYTPEQMAILERIARRDHGIVIACAPTGAGKSRTIQAVMRRQAQLFPWKKQITMEDPPEFKMPWATQLVVDETPEKEEDRHSHVKLLKHTMRMDPDSLLTGEVRDAAETQAMRGAAETGHFVLSTLHEGDLYRFAVRLEGFDFDRLSPRVTCDAGSVIGLIGQRLVSILCDDCKQPLDTASEEVVPMYLRDALRSWDVDLANVCVQGNDPACPTCLGKGTVKRVAIAEIVETNETLMSLLKRGEIAEAKRYQRARKGADKSMLEHALELVAKGELAPDQAHSAVTIVDKIEANGDHL